MLKINRALRIFMKNKKLTWWVDQRLVVSFCKCRPKPSALLFIWPSSLLNYNDMNAELLFPHKSLFDLWGSVAAGSYFSPLVCLMVWSAWLSSVTACSIDAEWCWHSALGRSAFPTANPNVIASHCACWVAVAWHPPPFLFDYGR